MNSTVVPALSLLSPLISLAFSSLPSHLYLTVPTKMIKSQTLSIIKQNVSNQKCASDLTKIVSDASNSELWALQMLDASGKINSGLLNGNIHLLGDYDRCLSISDEVDGRTIDGQYCTAIVTIKDEALGFFNSSSDVKNLMQIAAKMRISKTFQLTGIAVLLGLCVPKSCSAENLQDLARHVERKFKLPVLTTVMKELCSHKGKSVEITESDVLIYSFFSIVFVIVASSTVYDLHLRCSGQDPNVFVIFSAYTNLEKLLAGPSITFSNLSCLNGIKVLSCCWVILGHVALCSIGVSKNPLDVVTKWKYYKSGVFVWSAYYSVANFFTISGFLVTYTYLKYSEKMSINLALFYLGRFVRLTPAFVATSFVHTSLLKLIAAGPYGTFVVTFFKDNCHHDWWRVFFYFINFSKYEFTPHTWYLSIDSQLYLWAPFILFFIKKYPRTVLTGMTFAFLTGIIYSVVVTVSKRLEATVFDRSDDFREYLYLSCLYHLPSWLIGILLGYVLYQKKMQISRNVNLILWTVSIYVMLKLIFDQIVLVTEEYNVYRAALWNGLSKPLWSLALSFVVFSCATGNGGFINTFLSHHVFRVLGRLTYSISLIHMSVLIIFLGNKTDTFYYGYFAVMIEFFRIFLVTLVCSLLLYLGFEAPIMELKHHLERNHEKKKEI